MSLLNPSQIHKVLSSAGVTKAPAREDVSELSQLLNNSGLSPEEVLDNVGSIMRGGETEAVRLRAAELGLKLNGFINNNDKAISAPIVNITIHDLEINSQINPILIPR